MALNEVAPPGFGHTKGDKKKGVEKGGTAAAFDRARKEGRFKGSKSDMFAIMWSQKNKGDNPHYKPGTDKKYKKYQEEIQGGISMQDYDPNMKFREYEFIDIIKPEPLKKKIMEESKSVEEAISFSTWRSKSKKAKERKPQKAMDAGARAKRVLARKEYASKISGSTENVPDDIKDHKDWHI